MSESDSVICEKCGCRTPEDETTEINGDDYCEDCVDEYFVSCEDCGTIFLITEAQSSQETDCICPDCVYHWYSSCNECNELVYCDNLIVNNASCISICESCFDDHYFYCDYCEAITHVDTAWNNENGQYCEYCWNEHIHNDGINEYSYKPTTQYRIVGGQSYGRSLYFGVEMEMECHGSSRADTANHILENVTDDFVYIKDDGSLDCGIEAVTHPFTWEWMHNNMDQFRAIFSAEDVGALWGSITMLQQILK